MKVRQAKQIRGTIVLPGDKSISHRAAIFASIADGTSRVKNFAANADCLSTMECMKHMGVAISQEGTELTIRGAGKYGLQAPARELDCGNSGTTMRLLAGLLAGQEFSSVLNGDESLRKRPMRRVMTPLAKMGALIDSNDGRAPLKIHGKRPLLAGMLEPEAASAQIKSCLLLAGLFADGETSVVEKIATRDHTERMFRWMGVPINERETEEGRVISVNGASRLTARDLIVPGDLSSAAFFIVAAGLLEGSELLLPNVGLNPSRTAILDVLKKTGLDITETAAREVNNEPVADLKVSGVSHFSGRRLTISGGVVANLIDEIPVLAVAGTQLPNGIEVRDAGELRVKESDRISAVVENLKKMNAEVEEFPDGFAVGRSSLRGARIDSFGDHRIAMAFAVAALFADGETEITGADAASVSYPAFFDELARVIY